MKSKLAPAKWTFEALDLSSPKVMGILNLTPDSFYDGGHYHLLRPAIKQAEKMIAEGASIIDIGAFSTRPYAKEVGEAEEWKRMEKVLTEIRSIFPDIIISVDTYRSKIAEMAIEKGADMINDISGGRFDHQMFSVIAKHRVPYIMMHILGTPQTMQQNPFYENVGREVDQFLLNQVEKLERFGVNENIVLDPGFGFGKTVDHNYQLLHGLKRLTRHGFPVLAGVSRKSMINKVLDITPENALNGTTALHMLALINGALILRVHDVKEALETIRLYEKYTENSLE